jgi:hypothetical protein
VINAEPPFIVSYKSEWDYQVSAVEPLTHRPFGLIWAVKYSSDQRHILFVILLPMIAIKLWYPIHPNLRKMIESRVNNCF